MLKKIPTYVKKNKQIRSPLERKKMSELIQKISEMGKGRKEMAQRGRYSLARERNGT